MHGVALALGLLALAAACRAPRQPSRAIDEIAEGYVRVTLQMAQHNPDLVDTWRGPDQWRPGPRVPVATLLDTIRSLEDDVTAHTESLPPADAARRTYLERQLRALHVAADRLLGAKARPLMDEAADAFAVPMPRLAPDAEGLRAAMSAALPGADSLADRYAAYMRGLSVPPERQAAVMQAALDACREATLAAVTLPDDESVETAFVSGLHWDGNARYLGGHRSRIEVNSDAPLDPARALRLACHEGYPGHHVQYLWIDDQIRAARHWPEADLTPGFGWHAFAAEGAAEAGAALAFNDAQREAIYRDRLLPAAGLPPGEAARLVRVDSLARQLAPVAIDIVSAYLATQVTEVAAEEQLRQQALVPNALGLLGFAERRRALALAYPYGEAYVRSLMATDDLKGLAALAGAAGLPLH